MSSRDWRPVALALALLVIVQSALYWGTAASAVALWSSSSAYNYGFLIPAISGYLIWDTRKSWLGSRPQAAVWGGVGLVLVFGVVWFAADLVRINEGRHFAFVGMLQGVFLGVLGYRLFRRLAFPFLYLFLMVPTGDFLVPPLQVISHGAAVWMLRAVGTATYAEGMLIEVPFGRFMIEPGCAGLNFILAAIALSLLYGKLTYRTWWARGLAVVISVAIAIVANILRIFLIAGITQWTERAVDISSDHLLYGWAFFGVVMLVTMRVGMRFASAEPVEAAPASPAPAAEGDPASTRLLPAALATALALAVFPGIARWLDRPIAQARASLTLPAALGDWRAVETTANWSPGLAPPTQSLSARYVKEGRAVDLVAGLYRPEREGSEAASSLNQPVREAETSDPWMVVSVKRRQFSDGGRDGALAVIKRSVEERLVIAWYENGECRTASRLRAKLCAARNRLLGDRTGAYVAISSVVAAPGDETAALTALENFAGDLPAIAALVAGVAPAKRD